MKRFPACILCTCVVPWDERGEFIEELFADQVRRLLKVTDHLYIFGTAGEGYAVSDRQFEQVTRVFCETMRAAGSEPMVGVISLSLQSIVERIRTAMGLGVRLFQVSLPSWGALTDEEVLAFFAATCGAFPDCRFLHYNLLRAKRLVTPEQYAELARRHPNLVAAKNSTDSMHRLARLMKLAPELMHFFNEEGFAYASQLGECGWLASIATSASACRAYFEAARRRDLPALFAMLQEITAVFDELAAAAGPRVHIDAAFDKMLYKLQDERFPLRLLPPYEGASEDAFRRFAEFVRTSAPRWWPRT